MDEPVDLRSLLDEPAPDIVRGALRTFRRKLLVRAAWALVAVAASGIVLFGFIDRPRGLSEQIDRASTASFPGDAVWDISGVRVVLTEAASLGKDQMAVELVVAPPSGSRTSVVSLEVVGSTNFEPRGVSWFFTLPPQQSFQVKIVVSGPTCNGLCQSRFTIDLQKAGVEPSIWR